MRTLYMVHSYNPQSPGARVDAEIYGRREATALRDSLAAKHPERFYMVTKVEK